MSTLEDRKEDRIYSKVDHTLKGLNRTSPYDSHQLGTLKILDAIVEATDDDNVNKIDATLVLHEHALLALSKNTAEVLGISKGGSGLAIELVRRDLTELSVLVRVLYTSTVDQRAADEGLHRLYNTLAPVVELHGALVSAGVDVEQRAWAKALALQIPNLRRLRSTPWHEVALVLKLITLEEEDIEEELAEGDDSSNMTHELYDPTPWKNPPTRAEIRIVEELYAIGEGAPPIRQQVLGARLGLDVADQLEEMGIFDASTMTQEDARQLTSTAMEQLENKNKIEKAALGLKPQGMKVPIPDQATPAPDGSTPRALPALAGIAARLAPTILKLAPKLAKGSKLTNLTSKSKISGLSNKLNAMASNAGGGGGGGTSAPGAGGGAGDGLSGLVTTIKQAKEIKELLTPDLEAGVAAVELEKARLQSTMDNVRQELDRVSVAGKTEEELAKAQQALDKAKAAVAPIEGWQNRIASNATQTLQSSLQDQRLTLGTTKSTSSYSSNEEIVAKASGGAALYGMNFFPTTTDVVLKPYTPLLATPDFVEMTGAVANFEASVWQSTSVAKAASFHKISEHAGNSVAVQTTTSKGVSGSASTWIGSVSGSSSKEETNETTDTNANDNETESSEKTTTSTATVIEYIKCPMKSFRIPMTRMQLSEDARKTALEVKNMRDAEEFLDAFGSHVSNGRQELGGIFFSTITVTSREQVNSEAMMAAASYQSNKLKTKSSTKEGGGGGGLFGISAKASASFGQSSSVGKTSVNTSAESKNSEESGLEARYFQYIRCTGPRAPTPETFADALFNDNSSWAVTDRGPIEALVPVTRVLENTMDLMEDETEKIRMQSSVNFITAAWRKRAKKWGDVLLDEDSKVNKEVPNVILDLIRTAYPTAQGAVQELIDAVYGCLKFADSPTDEDFWGDIKRIQHSEDAAELVAAAILSAAQVATGGNSAPSLLSFLDAEDVGVYVQNHMDIKEEENKAAFFAEMKMKPDTKHDTEHDVSITLEECWAKLSPLVRFGKHDHDCKASDLLYFESLALWEQRWIEKDDHFQQNDHKWEAEDWEVFQMEFFKAGVASTFLPELARQLEISFKTANAESQGKGVVVRVVPADTPEHDKRREAVNEAASGLNGDDWVLFGKVWTTARHSEETGRVMEIIEDHLVFMKTLYKTPPDSEHIRELTARRDELLDMVRKANMFKEAKVAEVKRTKDTIDAIEVKTDPDTGEEDPVQQRKINKLKLQLEKATKESKFSTEQAVRAGISDKAELDAFDTRFKNSTVDHQLHNGDNGLVQSVINAKRDARNRNRDSYFESKGYFVNPPPATGKLGIGSGPPPPGGFLGLGSGPALPGGLLGFGSSPVV